MSSGDIIRKLKQELPSNVKLVAVSKFHPVSAIVGAYDCGQRVFGESRPQELASKVAELKKIACETGDSHKFEDIEWHFIGHLQTNKMKLVLPYVNIVESVDSIHLLDAIDNWGDNNGMRIKVLLEYHIASEETKQGLSEKEIKSVLFSDKKYANIVFCGLMGMATFTDDERVIRNDFSKIVALRGMLNSCIGKYPNLTREFNVFSFGMTHDYRIAVEMGANTVRIGTLIFGERTY